MAGTGKEKDPFTGLTGIIDCITRTAEASAKWPNLPEAEKIDLLESADCFRHAAEQLMVVFSTLQPSDREFAEEQLHIALGRTLIIGSKGSFPKVITPLAGAMMQGKKGAEKKQAIAAEKAAFAERLIRSVLEEFPNSPQEATIVEVRARWTTKNPPRLGATKLKPLVAKIKRERQLPKT